MIELLLGMDWSLLRQQKLTLIAVIDPGNGVVTQDLLGLLHFIDAIQDLAVSSGLVSHDGVFGEKDVYES